jgi:hypothetical protein
MTLRRNAGRRVIGQEEAQAIAAKAGMHASAPATARRAEINRREFLAYAMAASGALLTIGALITLTMPDPSADLYAVLTGSLRLAYSHEPLTWHSSVLCRILSFRLARRITIWSRCQLFVITTDNTQLTTNLVSLTCS